MLTIQKKKKLIANWGDEAEAMECTAEVRVYDPLSSWECYIYALNPENEDEIWCIVKGFFVEVSKWSLQELFSRYNTEGELVQVDDEYVPRHVSEIYRILKERSFDECNRY